MRLAQREPSFAPEDVHSFWAAIIIKEPQSNYVFKYETVLWQNQLFPKTNCLRTMVQRHLTTVVITIFIFTIRIMQLPIIWPLGGAGKNWEKNSAYHDYTTGLVYNHDTLNGNLNYRNCFEISNSCTSDYSIKKRVPLQLA